MSEGYSGWLSCFFKFTNRSQCSFLIRDEAETAVFLCEIVFVRPKTNISQCGV